MSHIYNPNQEIHIDKASRKLVVRKKQNTTPILEDNKIARNHRADEQKGEFQRIAQIPIIALHIKAKEVFGHANYYKLDKEQKKTLVKQMVNSNEFQNFRVGDKRL